MMTTQQAANELLAQWQREAAQGIKPEDRLRQDNRSEKEFFEELFLIDYHMSLEDVQ